MITPELIVAVGALVVSLANAYNNIKTRAENSRNLARKSDFDLLRGTIDQLQDENVRLQARNQQLEKRITELERENKQLREAFELYRPKGLARRDDL